MCHRILLVVLLPAIVVAPVSLRAADPDPSLDPASKFARHIWLLTNLVLGNHSESPSRPEIILARTRVVYFFQASLAALRFRHMGAGPRFPSQALAVINYLNPHVICKLTSLCRRDQRIRFHSSLPGQRSSNTFPMLDRLHFHQERWWFSDCHAEYMNPCLKRQEYRRHTECGS
jgi:hypothetical protein